MSSERYQEIVVQEAMMITLQHNNHQVSSFGDQHAVVDLDAAAELAHVALQQLSSKAALTNSRISIAQEEYHMVIQLRNCPDSEQQAMSKYSDANQIVQGSYNEEELMHVTNLLMQIDNNMVYDTIRVGCTLLGGAGGVDGKEKVPISWVMPSTVESYYHLAGKRVVLALFRMKAHARFIQTWCTFVSAQYKNRDRHNSNATRWRKQQYLLQSNHCLWLQSASTSHLAVWTMTMMMARCSRMVPRLLRSIRLQNLAKLLACLLGLNLP